MKTNTYYLSAFTGEGFSGNPAAICLLDQPLSTQTMQKVALEHNLPITTFIETKESQFAIRWFTPDDEIDLCGHGTLAAAAVLLKQLDYSGDVIEFNSQKSGILLAKQSGSLITLTFPSKNTEKIAIPEALSQGLGVHLHAVYQYKNDRVLAIIDSEKTIRQLKPDFKLLQQLKHRGIVVTAPSQKVDFVSRTFYPGKSIAEDPVTGSSHCLLVPYWAKRLNKENLHAYQLSPQGGELFCHYHNEYVSLSGKTNYFSKGKS